MTLYKLTDQADQTTNNTQWGPGITHTAPGSGKLCTAGWIHAYRDPVLAMMMNPAQGQFVNPHLWKAEGEVEIDDGTKVGCRSLTTREQIPVPEVTTEQRIRFGILAARAVCSVPAWVTWANDWLGGQARAANAAAYAAAYAANASPLDLVALAKEAISQPHWGLLGDPLVVQP